MNGGYGYCGAGVDTCIIRGGDIQDKRDTRGAGKKREEKKKNADESEVRGAKKDKKKNNNN